MTLDDFRPRIEGLLFTHVYFISLFFKRFSIYEIQRWYLPSCELITGQYKNQFTKLFMISHFDFFFPFTLAIYLSIYRSHSLRFHRSLSTSCLLSHTLATAYLLTFLLNFRFSHTHTHSCFELHINRIKSIWLHLCSWSGTTTKRRWNDSKETSN